MKLLLYVGGDATRTKMFLDAFTARLPEADIRVWEPGDSAAADYALVWKPPAELLAGRPGLKAVIYLAAGVEYLAELLRRNPGLVPAHVPLLRLEDAGMGRQMVEYAKYHVLRYFRRMHEYDVDRGKREWRKRPPEALSGFSVGVMGLGVLGRQVATDIADMGFPVRGWSRSPRQIEGIRCHAGQEQLGDFLDGLRVLVNLLPLTPETENILNRDCFDRMRAPGYLINIGRGHHLAEADLLAAIQDGRIGGAALDVFRQEPLPADHVFWSEPRINITPHIAAVTLNDEGIAQVVQKLRALEDGLPVSGHIDMARGY
ncbi:Glyoxylate/hydroxypyruvate reductase A [Bordetella sputigena]|uniref:2-hydroxyacid dehydrogenase n=1 Tax=Bordetella sputigena TaxID=1416810 RepID=UPI0039F041D4